MTKSTTPEYVRGWYAGLDVIIAFVNSLPSGDMTAGQVKSKIYHKCVESKPYGS